MFKGIIRFLIVAAVMTLIHRSVFEATAALTAQIINVVGLNSLNPKNWMGSFMGLATLAGVTWMLFRLTVTLFGRRRKQTLTMLLWVWSQYLGKSLAVGMLIYLICHVVGMTDPTKFLMSLILGVSTSPAVVVTGAGTLLRGFRLSIPKWIADQWFWHYIQDLIPWGAGFIKPFMEPTHFLLMGNTGMGKSTFLQVMMSRIRGARGVGIIPDMRAIVLDAKREWVPFFAALEVPFTIWNPLDLRGVAWAIGRDIQGEPMAQEFASSLFETDTSLAKNDNPYFPDTAKALIRNVITALWLACGDQWTLRHLILICSDVTQIQALLKKHHPRPNEVDELLKSRKQGPNEILTTVQSKLLPLVTVAARWDAMPEKRSLKDWVKREEVMVLGSDHIYQDTLKLTNSLILRFLIAELNTLPPSRKRRTWLYIDEAAAAGRFVQLEHLVALGRGAGVCVVIAFQNVAAFLETYTENVAKSIMGLCRHWAIFGVDMMSANWVAQQIGDHEELQTSTSESFSVQSGPSGVSTTSSVSYQTQMGRRPTILAQQLMDMNMRQPGPESGILAGFFIAPGQGIHYHDYAWEQIRHWQIDPLDEADCPAYLRVEDTDPSLSLIPLTSQERDLFFGTALQGVDH